MYGLRLGLVRVFVVVARIVMTFTYKAHESSFVIEAGELNCEPCTVLEGGCKLGMSCKRTVAISYAIPDLIHASLLLNACHHSS